MTPLIGRKQVANYGMQTENFVAFSTERRITGKKLGLLYPKIHLVKSRVNDYHGIQCLFLIGHYTVIVAIHFALVCEQ